MLRIIGVIFIFFSQLSTAQTIKFLALGDSYTIGESVLEHERWPNQLIDSIKNQRFAATNAQILATTGWRTDQLLQAINEKNLNDTFNLVSLLIGVNNQYQNKPIATYKLEFEQLLNKAIGLAGNQKSNVFVVSIPDYAYTPFGQNANPAKISSELTEFNAICKSVCDSIGVLHINITPISQMGIDNPILVANDGLHPSAEQYRLWVNNILDSLEQAGFFLPSNH